MIDTLSRELAAVGIRGRRRERILAEFADHLACDPRAHLGEPRELAQQFADDLGISATRRAALATFGTLALVALAVGLPQLTLPTIPDIASGRSILLVAPATLAVLVGSQIAFAAGCLAAVRTLRRPRDVGLVRRRTAVALAAGAATAIGSALYALNFWGAVPGWWAIVAVTAAGLVVVLLCAAGVACVRAGSVRVSRAEPEAGLGADLGLLARPALIGVGVTLLVLAATSVVERSLVEGAIRGAFEGVAFTMCYFAFRRPLALTS